jgi:hypothetical protein
VVVQLSTANEKFEFLLKIFAEKTRSPGMQAVYDLKDIFDLGYKNINNKNNNNNNNNNNNKNNNKNKNNNRFNV